MEMLYKELSPHCYILSSQFTDFHQMSSMTNERKTIDGALFQPELYCETITDAQSKVAEIHGKI